MVPRPEEVPDGRVATPLPRPVVDVLPESYVGRVRLVLTPVLPDDVRVEVDPVRPVETADPRRDVDVLPE